MQEILATKLFRPPTHPGLISRQHLNDYLDAALHYRLTLVSAPAGFGKTTLVSIWSQKSCCPTAWFTLDAGDNDITCFWAHLIVALQTIETTIGEVALTRLQLPSAPLTEMVLVSLLNDLAHLTHDCVLVLDDYHLIHTQAIHHALIFLLDHLPPQMHLIILTRTDPPLHLAHLRGQGHLAELRGSDLRFTLGETEEFLNQVMRLGLKTPEIMLLAERTEGWIAGIQMAGLSLRGQPNATTFIHSFTGSNRYVFEYLLEEVLHQQSSTVQQFLLQTSILDQLTGPLCNALTMQENGQATLELLERCNLFIMPLDHDRCWYRYHHLFADLLRQRLYQQEGIEQIAELHRRAGVWYEAQGMIPAAIEHMLAVPEYNYAAKLLITHINTLWGYGHQKSLIHWIESLPEEVTHAHPLLIIYDTLLLFISGEIEATQARLQIAKESLETYLHSSSGSVSYHNMIILLQAFVALYQGQIPSNPAYTFEIMDTLLPNDHLWHSMAYLLLADVHIWSGNAHEAEQVLKQAVKFSSTSNNAYFLCMINLRLIDCILSQGKLRQARDLCEQQMMLVEQEGLGQTPCMGGLLAYRAEIFTEYHDIPRALQDAHQAVSLCEQYSDVLLLIASYLCLVDVLTVCRHYASALTWLDKLVRLVAQTTRPAILENMLTARRAALWILQGNLHAASHLLEDERSLRSTDTISYLHEAEYLSLVRLYLARREYEPAFAILTQLDTFARLSQRQGLLISLLVLRALAYYKGGDTPSALGYLEQALELAEPEGYVSPFLKEGPIITELLYKVAAGGKSVSYIQTLLEVSLADPLDLDEPLSSRELEVLRLMAVGASNAQIAEQLVIAVNTVKKHITNIFAKLNATNRTEAVARAREIGLLK